MTTVKRFPYPAALLLALLLTFTIGAGVSQATPTTYTPSPVTDAEAGALFDFSSGADMTNVFDFAPITLGGDGEVLSGWAPGKAGTSGEGLYLYYYQLTVYSGSSDTLRGITLDFSSLVTTLDLNSDSVADPTFYCSDCSYPDSSWKTPESSSHDDLGTPGNPYDDVLTFWFISDPMYPDTPNDYSAIFAAVSPLKPMVVTANLIDSGSEASPEVFAPVPEPSALLLLGSAMVGAGVLRKKLLK